MARVSLRMLDISSYLSKYRHRAPPRGGTRPNIIFLTDVQERSFLLHRCAEGLPVLAYLILTITQDVCNVVDCFES